MNRKDEHISLAKAFHEEHKNDFDAVRIIHQSFPECRVADVSIRSELIGKKLATPFFINAMTGGSEKTKEINQQLAIIARETDLMLATGSCSAAIKDPSVADSFTIVRKENPDGLILANIGAGSNVEQAKKAVDLLEADGLQIHVNAPQELVMPEGDRDFTDWLKNIEAIVREIEVPVIVKEVGFGMTRETMHQILDLGVKTIDVGGNGGTSFTQIENARRKNRELAYLDHYGQSTVISLLEAYEMKRIFDIVASGGIRNAYDIFKCLCLGAKAVGISGTILHSLLTDGLEATIELVYQWKRELVMLYTMTGKTTTKELKKVPIFLTGIPKNWCEARHIDLSHYSIH